MQCLGALASPFTTTWHETKTAPRELFLIYLIALLSGFGMAGAGSIMVSYLTSEFGMSDSESSTFYACSAVTFVVFSLFTGQIVDRIGIRASLVVGGVLGVLGNITTSVANSRAILGVAVIGLLPLTMAFVGPVITVAMKRYTHDGNNRTAFMLAYILSNVGATLSLLYVDFVRLRFTDASGGARFSVLSQSYSATASRMIFATSAIATLLGAVVAACGIRDISVDDKGVVRQFVADSNTTVDELRASRARRWYSVLGEKNFLRLVALSLIMMPLFKVFRYFDVLFPKVAQRELGPMVRFGAIKSVNPIFVVTLQLPISFLFRNFHVYRTISIGSIIASIAVFVFVLPPGYETWVAGFVLFSLGETIFSHNYNRLTTKFMPKGREGVYATFASVCVVVPSFIVDSVSGWLLGVYCPEKGERHCQLLWLIIALSTCISWLLLFAFERHFLRGLDGEDEEHDLTAGPDEIRLEEIKTTTRDATNDDD